MNRYYNHAEEMETWMVGNLFKDLDTICITSILVNLVDPYNIQTKTRKNLNLLIFRLRSIYEESE